MARIDIRNLQKSYGAATRTLHGIDLAFESGEFVVILGPSGCGKSTLLRMIAGLEDITGGEIAIDGQVVNRLEPRERGCAMVFQNYALYPHMTVAANIGYALKVAGVPKAERERRVRETAAIVGLADFLDRKPAALSGGQRQRVAMGRAIVREPRVFLFDEPLSNLDAKLRVSMRAEIRKLHKRLSATSIFVTHDQVEAMTLADRLVVMNRGHVEQVGRPLDIYHRPRTTFVAGFIGAPAMNLVTATVQLGGAELMLGRIALQLAAPLTAIRAGTGVTLGIRPENVEIVPPGTPGALPVTVDFVEELGASRAIHTQGDGFQLAVTTSGLEEPASGDRLHLRLPAKDLHLFSPDTGIRLDEAAPAATETQRESVPA
ncbi:sn-glycerol-3-phosphate import ATP-binding protein UgpC 2 [Aureimonas endophytica]|uniref:Sn-glycerol-3-phosphate import ATP-binding protein UgpC 2 n=1 Tax=Aureimonas endophytica TaxID=2027858 RepID=A0A916ZQ84_9HYPH|nr:sn-glycerol-3-phosphate ABC transporter ATP-binding protein UgpC [Aureimonas endophytica]GGE07681.1 sn-glycerol-3-phosphate import ATP-binding protein UgpC 2 [Aureimonas endophytica]